MLCPNNCNNRGICQTIHDLSIYEGIDYDSTLESSGDGYGFDYSNWDGSSIMMCNCHAGYFGPDCSIGSSDYVYSM